MTSMPRQPEPELMLDDEQARAYAEADFSEPHDRFVTLFQQAFGGETLQEVLDLGCGPADVCVRFARAFPRCRILGIDGSPAMLRQARIRLARHADVHDRIMLMEGVLPLPSWCRRFSTIISNSLLHHLHDPQVLWRSIRALAAPGAAVQVMDLLRPGSARELEQLVALHAQEAPEILRRDFSNSLRAAFRVDEILAQLAAARLALTVEVVSDRHVLMSGRLA